MKWYFHWFPENVAKVKETLNDNGKNALKFLQVLFGYDKLESIEVRRIMQVMDHNLDKVQKKKQEEEKQ